MHLEDFRLNIRCKLSALWITTMFCYVYGDFFSLFVPDRLQHLMRGESGVGPTTPVSILAFAVMMTLPGLMIIGSLFLKPAIARWLNIVFGLAFTGIMAVILFTTTSEWMLFYRYLATIEIILTLLIVWHAWKWPKHTDNG